MDDITTAPTAEKHCILADTIQTVFEGVKASHNLPDAQMTVQVNGKEIALSFGENPDSRTAAFYVTRDTGMSAHNHRGPYDLYEHVEKALGTERYTAKLSDALSPEEAANAIKKLAIPENTVEQGELHRIEPLELFTRA